MLFCMTLLVYIAKVLRSLCVLLGDVLRICYSLYTNPIYNPIEHFMFHCIAFCSVLFCLEVLECNIKKDE